jgi:hypothetical protein
MSEVKINAALVTAATAALGAGFTNKTAWEGKSFTPPAGKWASVFRLPASNDVASLGDGGEDEHVGVFQIDVSHPENTGTALLTDIEAVRAYFIAGRSFNYQGQCVHVRRCDVSAIRRVDGWLRVSASIYYDAHSTRPTI